jgi:hypothetical protein
VLTAPLGCRYYLSGNDAFRLKLQLPLTPLAFERRKKEKDAILGFPEEMEPADSAVAEGAAHEAEIA